MSQTAQVREFRQVADKYIKGPQAKSLCQMMAHNAFLTEHRMREIEAGERVFTAFTIILREARKHVLEMQKLKMEAEGIEVD